MVLIHPRISHKRARSGEAVVASMVELLDKRWIAEIGRRQFLKRWKVLRAELRATKEYRAFRDEVRGRTDGICASCGKLGHVLHHKKRVATHPHLALDPRFAVWICRPCHAKEHPWLRDDDAKRNESS